MADFGLVKTFDIDDGQLDGLSPQECFVLGYELAAIDHMLTRPHRISLPVHAANKDRIAKSCEASHRVWRLFWPPDDVSETWLQLDVEPGDAT